MAIFASGRGSNAEKIIDYFTTHDRIRVALVVSNRSDAPVLKMANNRQVETLVIDRAYFYHSQNLLELLREKDIQFIVLAGFMWLAPEYLVKAYHRRMVNIHPALLPRHGGKGMYGSRVHRAVKAAGETETGITIHYVNEHYDEGDIIFQKRCRIDPEKDDPDEIARKVQKLEHLHYAPVIESLLMKQDGGR